MPLAEAARWRKIGGALSRKAAVGYPDLDIPVIGQTAFHHRVELCGQSRRLPYWPDLDIDLAVESIEHPEKYPLVSQAQPHKALQPSSRASTPPKPRKTSRAARRLNASALDGADVTPCECGRLPNTFFLDEAPDVWLGGLVEDAAGNWKTLRHCRICQRLFSVDAWDKYEPQVVAAIDDRARWEAEAESVARRKALLLQARGGTGEGACVWAGCLGTRVRGVAYCLDHLWKSGARR